MANTKHSAAREIIIDRLLHKRCGYSLYEMLEIVNQSLEVDGYNYVVDNSHPQSGQIYIKITKTAPGKKTTDVLTTPKDQELVNEITR